MVTLYVTSVEADGKTALCAGIGKKFLDQGKKVSYVVPVQISDISVNGSKEDVFINDLFGQEPIAESVFPLCLSRQDLWQSLTDDVEGFTQKISKACERISKGKDVVLMEGPAGLSADNVSTLTAYKIADICDAKVIIVLRYSSTLTPSTISRAVEEFGERFVGVVINLVPEAKMNAVEPKVKSEFEDAGIRILGVLPDVRSIRGISVRELAEAVGGETVTSPDAMEEIVENVMLGAMSLDSGLDYFGRKENKAVVVRGERADMQLAALQTSTRCLVLTNDTKPLEAVLSQAESKRVPIIVAPKDTSETVKDIEEALGKAAFNHPRKLHKFIDLMDKHLDMEHLFSVLGSK